MAILQRPYAGQVKNLTPPAAGCGGWFLAVGGVICCGRWAAGLAGCGVGRCWRWAAGCCEVWQGVQAVQFCGRRGHRRGAGGAGPSRCRWLAQYPGTASSAPRVLSSFSPGRPPTTPSACRAADPAGRAGGKAAQKKKARAAARCALLLWPSVCTGGAICCAGCVPVHIVGGGVCSPFRCRGAGAGTDPGATVPAGNVPAWHGLRWRRSIRCVFAVCRRGQILHLTGLRGRCRALT